VGTASRHKVHVITMGCAKNTVDSEKLLAQLKLSNVELTSTIEDADVAVINTCGFISTAKEESIDMIIRNVKLKSKGKLKRVYAMGCLTERYRAELQAEIPEVDGFFGSNQMQDVLEELGADYKAELLGERSLSSPTHSAYLKISEGCDNPCSFCAIPLMRGRHVSRPMTEILSETRLLAERGVKEVVVIAQDTTCYGLDIYQQRRLPELLAAIADVDGIEWVRLMYAYPAKFPLEVLDTIANHPRICKYLDMPVQHIADPVLRSMRRGISKRALLELIDTVRYRVPGVALRTTLIVGYPHETVQEFEELLEFVQRTRFERLGVFTYSHEEQTTAYQLADRIPESEKERRKALVMNAQKEISLLHNENLVGTKQRVLVDRLEAGRYVGRTEHDAPEIDNEVFIDTQRHLKPGTFIGVDIEDASEYDLYGSA
jgi:ribosomal protein S12 methylthiotransferase